MWALALGNPLARLAMAGALGLTLGFAGGFMKGHSWANASYWQEQARAAKQAAEDKEKLALADRERAAKAELQRMTLETQLEALIRDTQNTACRLSASDLKRLQRLSSGAH